MHKAVRMALIIVAATVGVSLNAADEISPRARKLHFDSIVVDSHVDVTQRLIGEPGFDFTQRHTDGHTDLPRLREGGLDAIFFSIWMQGSITGPEAVKGALRQIDAVRQLVAAHPRDMLLATTAADVRRAHKERKIAALMGMEGGHMIDDDLRVLRTFADLGVRYLTLTHSKNTKWADSSGDKPQHNGLTDFGKDVVRELNRHGVMVDISHVADKTFWDALAVSRAPMIASHSSCRAISNHPRNMSDEMIKALAAKGGVVMVNYYNAFLDQAYRGASRSLGESYDDSVKRTAEKCGKNDACVIRESDRLEKEMIAQGKLPKVRWEKIIEHIDHIAKLAGPDHVGLGSDFDGSTIPDGLGDVSRLPKITDALLKKGYSDKQIRGILGENILRVIEQVEKVSAEIRAGK